MTTKMDKTLFKQVRSLGVRKSRAREVAEAVRNSPKSARRVAGDLSGAVVEIQDRLNHGPEKRKAAAKKAAATRKQKAKRRSEAAEKAARTRARA
jgi:glycine cleavage system H lipoate-binding protein